MSSNCDHVTSICPVKDTLYGYRPNLGANTFFCVLFAVLLSLQIGLGVWKKTWTFLAWVSIGVFGELMGYIGRLIMHSNPWNDAGLEIQIVCLVLAPSFLAASIYLTLKHIVIHSGPQYSYLQPSRYAWIFVSCDVLSILFQAIGGGIAAGANSGSSRSLLNAGSDMIIVGISFQIATMLVFLGFAIAYYQRRQRAINAGIIPQAFTSIGRALKNESSDERGARGRRVKFYLFVWAISVAYIFIFIRSAWRIHEFAGGWGNPRMRDEASFLIMDGTMIAIACIALTAGHPGLLFPEMTQRK